MKRILTIAALLLTSALISAQEKKTYRDNVPHFYFATEFNFSGADYKKFGKPDFGTLGMTVSPGYRFDESWAVFVPIGADVVLMNRQSTRNYIEQGTLGLGTSYQLNMKDHMALMFVLSGGSTYIRSDLNYFKAKASVNLGLHGIGASPYVGFGCSYLKPYQNAMKDKVMFEATIGFQLF